MTTETKTNDWDAQVRERLEELSKFIPAERIVGAFDNLERFLNAMVWDTPHPDDAHLATALDLSLSLFDSPGGDPERLDHHVVALDGDYEGRGVVVEGCRGDGRFHCHYYDKLPWITMTAAEIEAQGAKEEGRPE